MIAKPVQSCVIKILHTRICRRQFIKNLPPEKRLKKTCKPNKRDLNSNLIIVST